MDWEVIAPMVVAILLILSIAGVILLRPISRRLGDVLEAYAKEKDSGTVRELRQIRELFETMDQRLRLMEERQDFTEKILGSSAMERISRPGQDQQLKRPSSAEPPSSSA